MKEQQKRSLKHLPFKVGDKVVICPHKSNTHERGSTALVFEVLDHLSVLVEYERQVIRHGDPKRQPTYNLRHASECHRCVHRVTHLSGGVCPQSWKEVKFVDEVETSNE
jgi:hypothetical protein